MLSSIAALRDSENYFYNIVEHSCDAFFLHDFEGRLMDVNRQACETLGYTRDELLQMNVLAIEVEFDLAAAQALWGSISPGRCITFKGRQRRKDGTTFPIDGQLTSCEIAGQTVYLGLVRDVTAAMREHEALVRSEEQYRSLFDSMDEAFCVVELVRDAQGRFCDYLFLEVNPAFERHVGLLGAAGKTIRELVPEIEKRWIDIYGEVVTTGEPIRFTEHSPSLNRWFEVYAFRTGGDGSQKVAILFTNITERVVAEQALRKSEKLALVGRLAGVISHEIRGPIESLTNLMYLMESEPDMATVRGYVRMAQTELANMSQIVGHTLQFHRQLPAAAVRLSEIVESAVAIYASPIRQTGVKVRREYEEFDAVACLSSELRQVFANLIGNALDAMENGGTLMLRTHCSHNWRSGEEGVRVVVADTGSGMSAETMAHLFEALYTTKGVEGTGLGLWVSQEILARHGAAVAVKSRQEGKKSGTVFSVWFPLRRFAAVEGVGAGLGVEGGRTVVN